jgi:tripartite-type tricarboxylate transporter receptor subunit TctC
MQRMFMMLLIGVGLVSADIRAEAQTWPTKPIRAIVPFGAGSAIDVVARIVLQDLSSELGQAVVVENRPGAGGTIGSAQVAKSEPDGYTLLVAASAHSMAPAVYPNLSYDVARDFAAVIPLGSLPNVLVTPPVKGFKTIQEFVAAAKAKAGSFNYTSAGVGTVSHLSAERFRLSAGFQAAHVPFKGGGEALTEVIAGRAEFYFCPIATALSNVHEGRVVALAVSSPKRASALPDVPTTLEAGFPESDYTFWLGLFVRAATAREIVDKIHHASHKALQAPSMQEKLAKLGIDPMVMTPGEFDAYVRKDITDSAALVKAAGIKAH